MACSLKSSSPTVVIRIEHRSHWLHRDTPIHPSSHHGPPRLTATSSWPVRVCGGLKQSQFFAKRHEFRKNRLNSASTRGTKARVTSHPLKSRTASPWVSSTLLIYRSHRLHRDSFTHPSSYNGSPRLVATNGVIELQDKHESAVSLVWLIGCAGG